MASHPDHDQQDPPKPENLPQFLDHFLANHRDDNFIAVKHGNYTVQKYEIVGEVVDWTMQYLQYMSCPASLEAGLTRAVLDEARSTYLTDIQDQVDSTAVAPPPQAHTKGFRSLNLLQNVTSTVNEVCRRLKSEEKSSTIKNCRLVPNSVCAVKNGRRKMEDRHVVLHDINMIFSGHANQSSEDVPVSFYAVYDGHAGRDAAAFAASHLHGRIFESPFYPSDPVTAIKEAFNKTDVTFLEKGKYEALKSGTTAVVALIRGNTIYSAWLGDSQSVLVRNGKPIKIVEPHKPNRPDEKSRIEGLGGTVIYWGTWRVNGQLAVSRAIGDGDYKPYVSADPDVTSIEMNGTEDFIIIACDGLWDTVTPEEATNCVFTQLLADKDNLELVSQKLVTLAKDNGSSDNISIIVVFLKPIDSLIKLPHPSDRAETKENLYSGITSTCKFIMNGKANGDEHYRFYSNGEPDNDKDGLSSPNPFSSDFGNQMSDYGLKSGDGGMANPFSSPDGGGYVYNSVVNPFADMVHQGHDDKQTMSDDGNDSLDDVIANLNAEKFKEASTSLFDDPSIFAKNSDRGSSSDFMAHQANAWIPSPSVAPAAASAQQHHFNPFAPKSDSGFISPACNSHNHSASSEDSAENHEERVAAASVTSEDDEMKYRRDSEEVDEPDHHREVTQLLSGGIIGTQFGELMMSARNETPTPPVEDEEGSTLEDILAAARDQPDSVADDDEDDSDTSGEEEKDQVDSKFASDDFVRGGSSVGAQVEDVDSSDSEEEEEENGDVGFTFLKQDDSTKPEVILKSALYDEKESAHYPEDNFTTHKEPNYDFQGFERSEPLVSQSVEQSFFDQHFAPAGSNVVDLIQDNDDHFSASGSDPLAVKNSDVFCNPFYQDKSSFNQFEEPVGNQISSKEHLFPVSSQQQDFSSAFDKHFNQEEESKSSLKFEPEKRSFHVEDTSVSSKLQEDLPRGFSPVDTEHLQVEEKSHLESEEEEDHSSFQYQREFSSSVEKCVFDQQEKEKEIEVESAEEEISECDFVSGQPAETEQEVQFDHNKNPFVTETEELNRFDSPSPIFDKFDGAEKEQQSQDLIESKYTDYNYSESSNNEFEPSNVHLFSETAAREFAGELDQEVEQDPLVDDYPHREQTPEFEQLIVPEQAIEAKEESLVGEDFEVRKESFSAPAPNIVFYQDIPSEQHLEEFVDQKEELLEQEQDFEPLEEQNKFEQEHLEENLEQLQDKFEKEFSIEDFQAVEAQDQLVTASPVPEVVSSEPEAILCEPIETVRQFLSEPVDYKEKVELVEEKEELVKEPEEEAVHETLPEQQIPEPEQIQEPLQHFQEAEQIQEPVEEDVIEAVAAEIKSTEFFETKADNLIEELAREVTESFDSESALEAEAEPVVETVKEPQPAVEEPEQIIEEPKSTVEIVEEPELAAQEPEPIVAEPEPAVETFEEPKPAVETVQEPEPTVETLEEPEPTVETSEEPEPTVETSEEPEPTVETSEEPEPTVETSEEPEPTVETSEEPEPTVETSEEPEPAVETVEEPELTVQELEQAVETLEEPEPAVETVEEPEQTAEEPKPAVESVEEPEPAVQEPEPAVESVQEPEQVVEELSEPEQIVETASEHVQEIVAEPEQEVVAEPEHTFETETEPIVESVQEVLSELEQALEAESEQTFEEHYVPEPVEAVIETPAEFEATFEEVIEQVPAGSTLNALDPEPCADSAPSSLESQSGPSSVIVESQEVPIPDQASFFVKASEPEQIDLPTRQEPVVEVIPEASHQSPILEESEEVTSDSEEKSVMKMEDEPMPEAVAAEQVEAVEQKMEELQVADDTPTIEVTSEEAAQEEVTEVEAESAVAASLQTPDITFTPSSPQTVTSPEKEAAPEPAEEPVPIVEETSPAVEEPSPVVEESAPVTEEQVAVEDSPVSNAEVAVAAVAVTAVAGAAVAAAVAGKKTAADKTKTGVKAPAAAKPRPGAPAAKPAAAKPVPIKPVPATRTAPRPAPTVASKPAPKPVDAVAKKPAAPRPASATAPKPTTATRPAVSRPAPTPAVKKEIEKKPATARPTSATAPRPASAAAPKPAAPRPTVTRAAPRPATADPAKVNGEKKPAISAPARSALNRTITATARSGSPKPAGAPATAPVKKAPVTRNGPAAPAAKPAAPRPAVSRPTPATAPRAAPVKKTVTAPGVTTAAPASSRIAAVRATAASPSKAPARPATGSPAKRPMSSSGPKPTDLTKRKASPTGKKVPAKADDSEKKVNGEVTTNGEVAAVEETNGVNGHNGHHVEGEEVAPAEPSTLEA